DGQQPRAGRRCLGSRTGHAGQVGGPPAGGALAGLRWRRRPRYGGSDRLQRTCLEIVKNELAPPKEEAARPSLPFPFDDAGPAGSTAFKAIAREAVAGLKQRIEANLPRAADSITRAHLKECAREIDVMLTEKK